jgi:hypothetical protein
MMPPHSITIRICSVPECNQPHHAKRFCRLHYRRLQATGSTELLPRPDEQERFWARVDKNGPLWNGTPCWEWTGCRVRGYGTFSLNGKMVRAPRFAYETLVGLFPDGLVPDHLCRNRGCVRPLHLEPVTLRVNTLRGESFSAINARKTHCKRGHIFDQTNTYTPPRGERVCRICQRNHEKARRR